MNAPRIAVLLLCRDELDILPAWWRHHSAFADEIFVTDNGSIDGTRDWLAERERDGNVTVIDDPDRSYRQREWTTAMARLARERGCDWVISTDADELWCCPEGWRAFCASHEGEDYADQVLVSPHTYRVTPADDEGEPDPVRRIRYREPGIRREWNKGVFRNRPDLNIYRGNHYARFGADEADDRGVQRRAPIERAWFRHYFSRGWEHYRQKIIERGEYYVVHCAHNPHNWGWHLRDAYAVYLAGGLPALWERWRDLELGDPVELVLDPHEATP